MSLDQLAEDQMSMVLAELGLNEYETRAYLTILEGGVVVAREVSDRASIPYAKVYQTLNSIIAKQLILGDEGRPKKFRALNPNNAMQDYMHNIEIEWKKTQNRRKKLLNSILSELNSLFNSSGVDIEHEQGVWNIVGLSNIVSRISNLIQKTDSKLQIIEGKPSFIDTQLYRILKELPRKMKLNIVSKSKIKFENATNSKIVDKLGNAVILFFDDFAMMTIVEINKGKYGLGEYTAVLTQISEIVLSNMSTYSSTLDFKVI